MRSLVIRVALGVAAGVAIYVGYAIWRDASQVATAMSQFAPRAALIGLLLAAANYLVRWVRWEYYLRVLGYRVPTGDSVMVFLAGFSLTVTPGKLGEAVKAFLLREAHGIPVARTAPIVVAERVTDLIGCLALACVGAFTFNVPRGFLVACAVLVVVGLAVVSIRPLAHACIAVASRLPGLRRVAHKLHEFYDSTATMLKPAPLVVGVVLSTVSWFCECLAFWFVVKGFPGADVALDAATFIYAAMTIAGAISFLPGGLGVTEGGMLLLLGRLGTGIGSGAAAAATFITRLCTLWFAVALGMGALILFARRRRVDVSAVTAATPASAGPT